MRIAIITGASSGLGRDFALQLAASEDLDAFWLVARRRDRLEALAPLLGRGRGRVFAVDLTDAAGRRELFDALDADKPDVRWLVNNAGFGKVGTFDEVDVDVQTEMIDLNVRALTELTQRALPYCSRGSQIVQVASTAGFAPMPGSAVYAATKAYVLSLANALAFELRPRGIHVTAVCPGPVATEFQQIALSTLGPAPSSIPAIEAGSAAVVSQALRDARRGKLMSIYGRAMKAYDVASRILPRRLVIAGTERIKSGQRRRAELAE